MENYIAPDSKRVLVLYPDNTSRETTVKELKEQFKEETKAWKDYFFNELTTKLEAYGSFAKYSILLD